MFHLPNQSWNDEYQNQQQCLVFDPAQGQTAVAHSHSPRAQHDAGPQNVISSHVDTAAKRASRTPEATGQMKTFRNKSVVDTSAFSIEERLVAAVWVHERKLTRSSMSQIKREFRQRFNREPPAKNTLLVWERKLFSTGSVRDAPRPGRPVKRSSKVECVAASVRGAPALSQRARAAALRVPRSTLRTILRDDLRLPAPACHTGKQRAKSRVRTPARRQQECAPHCLTASHKHVHGYT